MKYTVYQHWDPLKVCIVGRSYGPEFYSFIKNTRVRSIMERIAQETEEDYQTLIKLLESFDVTVLRPNVHNNYKDAVGINGKIKPPPMTPRDYTASIGNNFFISIDMFEDSYHKVKGADWPRECPRNKNNLPDFVKNEIINDFPEMLNSLDWVFEYKDLLTHIEQFATVVKNKDIDTAMVTRVGKDLYHGKRIRNDNNYTADKVNNIFKQMYPEYRWHVIDTDGHTDSSFCPVVPGLIVSLMDMPAYADSFPGWEVVYLMGQSWEKVKPFLELKKKNQGKWWVPGEELNNEFIDFVEGWLDHWVGYVEETVFDVNMLVIDEKNVVCNNYNKDVFDAFERRGITPHIVNFRHRYFWDGGLHCITSDIHREGTMTDYFPERG